MYAIVRVGNKQYRVEQGDSLLVDRMPEDEGSKVKLEPLLYRSDETVFDAGELAKVSVEAVVTGHERGKKIHGLKFKPKHGYKRRYGARADLTRIEIKEIKLLSRKPAAKKDDEPAAKKDDAPAVAKPAAKKPAAKKEPAAKKAPAKPAAKKAAAKKPAAKKEDEDGS